jgi:hypothetical protein
MSVGFELLKNKTKGCAILTEITVREMFIEILKKADRNTIFEPEHGDYILAICNKKETEDLIQAAIQYMDGDKKEIFEHMFHSSKIALGQIKSKERYADKKKKN